MKALRDYFSQERGRLTRVSEATGLSPTFLSRIARGERKPRLDNLVIISEATGLSVSALMGIEKRKARA